MERTRIAGFGLVVALAILSGCAEPVPPPAAAPPPPPPVAVVPPPPAPVTLLPPKYYAKHHAKAHAPRVHHAASTRKRIKRYHSARASYAQWPPCGTTVHPCNREHVEVPPR